MTPVERLETIIALAGLDPEQFKITPCGDLWAYFDDKDRRGPAVSAWDDGSLLASLPPHNTVRRLASIEDVVVYIRGAQ